MADIIRRYQIKPTRKRRAELRKNPSAIPERIGAYGQARHGRSRKARRKYLRKMRRVASHGPWGRELQRRLASQYRTFHRLKERAGD